MNQNGSAADDAQDETTAATLFEKLNDLDEGDDLELLGESLTVGHVRVSAASKELLLWGRHEDMTQENRYAVVLDARYDSFEVFTDRTPDN